MAKKTVNLNGKINGVTRAAGRNKSVHRASFPELNPNPVLEVDPEGNITYLNPATRKRFPRLLQQGKDHPFLAAWEALAAQIIREKIPLLTRDINVDDSWYEQAISYVPSPGRFRIYTRDITARKKAEMALLKTNDEMETLIRERTREVEAAYNALKSEIAERILAEKAVTAQRQTFNDLLEKLPCYLVLLTPDYHVRFANKFFRERFGEDQGRRCFEYLFNRREPCEVCETYKVLKEMRPLEWEWTGPDGHNYYIFDYPFKDTGGTDLIMEVGIDITVQKNALADLQTIRDELEERVQERTRELKEVNRLLRIKAAEYKQAEEREKRAAKEWQTTFDSITDMVSIQDRECRLVRVNKAYAAAAGMKPEELIGKKCYAVIHQTACPIENCPQEETFKTGKTVTMEWFEPRLGTYFEVTTSPVFDENGEVSGTVHIAKNITERKEADDALLESQQDLNRAQAVAQVGSWRLNVRRDILSWSDETYRMFSIPVETPMTYETFLSAVHPEDRDFVDRAWQAALHGEPYDIEHRIVVGNDIKWVRERAELEFDKNGALLGGFGTVQDVTERKQMDKMKDEFIGLVSHELRTPLTVITGSLHTATFEGLPPEEVRELIQNAIEGADQLATILENMLELSRHQAGRLKLNVEPVSIAGVTGTVIKKLKGQRVSQEFSVDIPKYLPPVEADPVRVERVLYNLLENATKYSPEGSRVTVSAREDGDLVITAVTDQGPGIAPEDQPKIFEQFQQLENTSRPIRGAGLGLVVCKRLVEAQGGWIKVDSVPGRGSTFSFALPKSTAPL
jgi:PAS domain S-box-containing protein